MWTRWRWHITLLRARGELALAEGRHDEAWDYAVQSLDMASRTDARKHVVRAQWLQGEVLAASGRLEEAARAVEGSVRLAETLQTPRELWMGKAVLGKVLARMGKDKEAEAQFTQAVKVIEAIAEKLKTPRLRHSFLSAEPVLEVYRALGRRPPHVTS
jgi:ATP/maltotriose-dependent transcriptional regulator MalT